MSTSPDPSSPSNAILHAALAGHALPAPPWATLGSGVWGDVFDLGDGTVLKLVRHTGGIGSGESIFTTEVAALKSASGLGGLVTAAQLHGSSAIDPDAHALTSPLRDFCGWIRMSKLPGATASAILSATSDTDRQASVMRRLGEAAALFHRQIAEQIKEQAPGYGALPALSQERLAQIADIVPDMRSACSEVAGILASGPQHPFLHGDINGGNVLLSDPHSIEGSSAGLVDWGETQSGPVEIELRHMHEIGGPAEAMREGYEETSGSKVDQTRLAAAMCLNALGTLAIATLGTVRGLDPVAARTIVAKRLKALTA